MHRSLMSAATVGVFLIPSDATPTRGAHNRGAVYGFAVADLDGDGQLDIAAARSEAPNMIYFGSAGSR